MAILLKMPEIAANMESALIVAWTKAEGDTVALGDCLAEIETDKAIVEFNAENEGVLGKILVPAGKEATVSEPIAVLLAKGETAADAAALLEQVHGASPAVEPVAVQTVAVPDVATELAPVAPVTVPAQAVTNTSERIFASPLARRIAANEQLSLIGLQGSGPHGRIVRKDVQEALQQASKTTILTASASSTKPILDQGQSGVTQIAHTAMRRTIARRLLESKTTVPHFYLSADCRMDELLVLRNRINASVAQRISVNDLIVKAVAQALVQFPQMNVSWTDEALLRYDAVDVSVAVATDSGLITPIVRQAGQKNLSTISADIKDLVNRAREGHLQPNEYQGGSFTVSNLGMYGVKEFAAIINPPQAAILAAGATEKRAIVDADENITVASVMTVTLSVDHRAIDGALAAQWLKAFKHLIESPMSILI